MADVEIKVVAEANDKELIKLDQALDNVIDKSKETAKAINTISAPKVDYSNLNKLQDSWSNLIEAQFDAKRSLEDFMSKNREFLSTINNLESSISAIKKRGSPRLSELEQELSAYKNENKALVEQYELLKKNVATGRAAIESTNSEIVSEKERIGLLKDSIASATSFGGAFDEVNSKVLSVNNEISELNKQLALSEAEFIKLSKSSAIKHWTEERYLYAVLTKRELKNLTEARKEELLAEYRAKNDRYFALGDEIEAIRTKISEKHDELDLLEKQKRFVTDIAQIEVNQSNAASKQSSALVESVKAGASLAEVLKEASSSDFGLAGLKKVDDKIAHLKMTLGAVTAALASPVPFLGVATTLEDIQVGLMHTIEALTQARIRVSTDISVLTGQAKTDDDLIAVFNRDVDAAYNKIEALQSKIEVLNSKLYDSKGRKKTGVAREIDAANNELDVLKAKFKELMNFSSLFATTLNDTFELYENDRDAGKIFVVNILEQYVNQRDYVNAVSSAYNALLVTMDKVIGRTVEMSHAFSKKSGLSDLDLLLSDLDVYAKDSYKYTHSITTDIDRSAEGVKKIAQALNSASTVYSILSRISDKWAAQTITGADDSRKKLSELTSQFGLLINAVRLVASEDGGLVSGLREAGIPLESLGLISRETESGFKNLVIAASDVNSVISNIDPSNLEVILSALDSKLWNNLGIDLGGVSNITDILSSSSGLNALTASGTAVVDTLNSMSAAAERTAAAVVDSNTQISDSIELTESHISGSSKVITESGSDITAAFSGVSDEAINAASSFSVLDEFSISIQSLTKDLSEQVSEVKELASATLSAANGLDSLVPSEQSTKRLKAFDEELRKYTERIREDVKIPERSSGVYLDNLDKIEEVEPAIVKAAEATKDLADKSVEVKELATAVEDVATSSEHLATADLDLISADTSAADTKERLASVLEANSLALERASASATAFAIEEGAALSSNIRDGEYLVDVLNNIALGTKATREQGHKANSDYQILGVLLARINKELKAQKANYDNTGTTIDNLTAEYEALGLEIERLNDSFDKSGVPEFDESRLSAINPLVQQRIALEDTLEKLSESRIPLLESINRLESQSIDLSTKKSRAERVLLSWYSTSEGAVEYQTKQLNKTDKKLALITSRLGVLKNAADGIDYENVVDGVEQVTTSAELYANTIERQSELLKQRASQELALSNATAKLEDERVKAAEKIAAAEQKSAETRKKQEDSLWAAREKAANQYAKQIQSETDTHIDAYNKAEDEYEKLLDRRGKIETAAHFRVEDEIQRQIDAAYEADSKAQRDSYKEFENYGNKRIAQIEKEAAARRQIEDAYAASRGKLETLQFETSDEEIGGKTYFELEEILRDAKRLYKELDDEGKSELATVQSIVQAEMQHRDAIQQAAQQAEEEAVWQQTQAAWHAESDEEGHRVDTILRAVVARRDELRETNLINKAIQTGRVLIDSLRSGWNSVTKAVNKHLSTTRAVNSVLRQTNSILAALGVRASLHTVVSAMKEGITSASNYAEIVNTLEIAFKNSARSIQQWSDANAKAFNLTSNKALEYTSNIGAILKTSGVNEAWRIVMAENMTKLAGDLASYYDKEIESMYEKIRSGLAGQARPLLEIGINIQATNLNDWLENDLGFKKRIEDMTQLEKEVVRYGYLLTHTKDIQGDFARTSQSFSNQLRTLKQEWQSFLNLLGSYAIPLLQPIVLKLREILAYATAVVKAIAKILGLQQYISTAKAPTDLSMIWDDTANSAEDVTDQMKKQNDLAKKNVKLLDLYELDFGDAADSGTGADEGPAFNLDDFFKQLGDYEPVSFSDFIAIDQELVDKIANGIVNAFKTAYNIVTGLWSGFWRVVGPVIQPFWDFLNWLFDLSTPEGWKKLSEFVGVFLGNLAVFKLGSWLFKGIGKFSKVLEALPFKNASKLATVFTTALKGIAGITLAGLGGAELGRGLADGIINGFNAVNVAESIFGGLATAGGIILAGTAFGPAGFIVAGLAATLGAAQEVTAALDKATDSALQNMVDASLKGTHTADEFIKAIKDIEIQYITSEEVIAQNEIVVNSNKSQIDNTIEALKNLKDGVTELPEGKTYAEAAAELFGELEKNIRESNKQLVELDKSVWLQSLQGISDNLGLSAQKAEAFAGQLAAISGEMRTQLELKYAELAAIAPMDRTDEQQAQFEYLQKYLYGVESIADQIADQRDRIKSITSDFDISSFTPEQFKEMGASFTPLLEAIKGEFETTKTQVDKIRGDIAAAEALGIKTIIVDGVEYSIEDAKSMADSMFSAAQVNFWKNYTEVFALKSETLSDIEEQLNSDANIVGDIVNKKLDPMSWGSFSRTYNSNIAGTWLENFNVSEDQKKEWKDGITTKISQLGLSDEEMTALWNSIIGVGNVENFSVDKLSVDQLHALDNSLGDLIDQVQGTVNSHFGAGTFSLEDGKWKNNLSIGIDFEEWGYSESDFVDAFNDAEKVGEEIESHISKGAKDGANSEESKKNYNSAGKTGAENFHSDDSKNAAENVGSTTVDEMYSGADERVNDAESRETAVKVADTMINNISDPAEARKTGKQLIDDIGAGFEDGLAVGQPLPNAVDKLLALLNGIPASFNSAFHTALDNIADNITKFSGNLRGAVESLGISSSDITVTELVSKLSSKSIYVPHLASGAVLYPNNPFLAVVGDQRRGVNVEAPLSTIEEAVEKAMSGIYTDRPIYVDVSVRIGDDSIRDFVVDTVVNNNLIVG